MMKTVLPESLAIRGDNTANEDMVSTKKGNSGLGGVMGVSQS